MQQLLTLAQVLGGLMMVFSATFVLPLGWSLAIGDGSHPSFLKAAAGTFLIGLAMWGPTRRYHRELQPRDGCLIVVLAWVSMALASTTPFLLEIKGLSFTDAFFECISGLTTTGATVMVGLEHLPQSLNIWRHAMQWFGGMGIIVLAVAILPLLGVGGMQLFKAETPGPMKEGKLTPRITQTAKYLWLLYTTLTLLCILALRWAGMDWFEAVCHGFSALSLGGFSTRDASVQGFESLEVEIVLSVFMLIAVLNFTTHFLAVRRRTLRVYLHDAEALPVLGLILGSCVALAAYLYWKGYYPEFLTALRHTSFNVISIATSTGYMSADYDKWPILAPIWMMFLCAIGSSAGSTGGGVKMIRVLILIKQAGHELVHMVHPRAVTPLCLRGHVVNNRVVLAVVGYMLLYGATLIGLTFVMLATGMDFVSAFSGVVASLNNTGPGLGLLGPTNNFQALTDFQTWVLGFAMLAGRLELLTIFVLFTPGFWRK